MRDILPHSSFPHSSLPHSSFLLSGCTDSSIRALASDLVKLEEAKLAKQKKQMQGFLKGKSFGGGGEDETANGTNGTNGANGAAKGAVKIEEEAIEEGKSAVEEGAGEGGEK